MVLAISGTGLRSLFLLLPWVTVSSPMLDFWCPKSIETDSARCRWGLPCGTTWAPLRKTTSRGRTGRVFRSPLPT